MKIVVKEQAIRQFLREAMFSTGNVESGDVYDPASPPVSVNSVVDPSAVVTDPDNPNYTPQNKSELQMSLNALTGNVSDDKVVDVYNAVKEVIDSLTKEKSEKEDPGMKDTKVEALIRAHVRKMLREAAGGHAEGPSSAGLSSMIGSSRGKSPCEKCDGIGTDPETGSECKACDGSGEVETGKKYDTVKDVGGATLQQLAASIGQKSAGKINDLIDSSMAKVKDRVEYLPNETIDKIYNTVMKAYDDYVQELIGTGELTPADIQFLADHPDAAYEEFEGLADFRAEIDSIVDAETKKLKLTSKPKSIPGRTRR